MFWTRTRAIYLMIIILTFSAWGIALYLQLAKDMPPCALCIIQRLMLLVIGLIALVAFIHHPKHWMRKIYAALMLIFSLVGTYAAGFQLWLQHHPNMAHTCSPGFNTLIKEYSLPKVIAIAFQGTTDCSDIYVRFLSLTLPGWTTVLFIYIALLCLGIIIYFGFFARQK